MGLVEMEMMNVLNSNRRDRVDARQNQTRVSRDRVIIQLLERAKHFRVLRGRQPVYHTQKNLRRLCL